MTYTPAGWLTLSRAKLVSYGASLGLFAEDTKEDLLIFDQNSISKHTIVGMNEQDSQSIKLLSAEINKTALIYLQLPIIMYDDDDTPINFFAKHPSLVRESDPVKASYGWILQMPEKYSDIPENLGLPSDLTAAFSPTTSLVKLRRKLSLGQMQASLIQANGSITDVPNHYWNSDPAWDVLQHEVGACIEIDGKFLTGRIIFNLKSIENYYSSSQEDVSDEEYLDYIPPFIGYMLNACKALGLSAEIKVGKEIIIHWLSENWPPDLGEKTDRKLEYMATFMRSPEAQTGGFLKPPTRPLKTVGLKKGVTR